MTRRGGLVLAVAALVAAALASTAGAGSASTQRSQALSCSSTLKLAMVAPFTGGAGFLGNEQLSWAKYAVKTLAPKMGLKIQLVTGDTPVEQGAAPAQTLAQKFVADKNVVGVTTNPSIFQAAIGSGEGYEEQLADLAVRGVTVDEAVRMMTTADVRAAADILRPVYDATDGRDGRVSSEVDPRLEDRLPQISLLGQALGHVQDVELRRVDVVERFPQLASGVVLISTRAERDFGGLVKASPAAGFVPKLQLSARAVREVVANRSLSAREGR